MQIKQLLPFYRNGFRILIAGGGTGASTVHLAEQLNHTNAEIIYLDFSFASKHIAQQRAKFRKLQNIIWISESIEQIHFLNIGRYDYIQCSGVLHHLKSPRHGLNRLKEVLNFHGGMDLMLYNTGGRLGVYQIQNLLRLTNGIYSLVSEELKNAKVILRDIPISNWFKNNDDLIDDHRSGGDPGIYDLLLHKQDVSYSTLEVTNFVRSAGIFDINYTTRDATPLYYESEEMQHFFSSTQSADLLQEKKDAILDFVNSNGFMNNIFVSKLGSSEASINNFENVLYLLSAPVGFKRKVLDINSNDSFFALSNTWNYDKNSYHAFAWPINKVSKCLLKIIVRANGGMELDAIFTKFRQEEDNTISNAHLVQYFTQIYYAANKAGLFMLKHKSIGDFPKSSRDPL